MPAPRIVEPFDELEDGHPSFGLGRKLAAVEQLALERREEALAQSVVVAVADGSHGGTHAGLPAPFSAGDRGVLRSMIRVMHALSGSPLPESHVESIEHELGPQVCGHRPAHDLAAPGI